MLTHCYKYPFCRSLVCACLCCCQETLLYFSSVRNLLKSLVCSFTYVFFFFPPCDLITFVFLYHLFVEFQEGEEENTSSQPGHHV